MKNKSTHLSNLIQNDKELGIDLLAGVDEAGRGSLAGPVVVAAVILSYQNSFELLNDSKKLTAKTREKLYDLIKADSLAFSIVVIEPEIVDKVNVLQASLQGMKEAINKLGIEPKHILVDGPYVPINLNAQAVVRGDGLHACIAAASILAKVYRDKLMQDYHRMYPQYGFQSNKGYGSPGHLKALALHGPSPIHRHSFKPVNQQNIWDRVGE